MSTGSSKRNRSEETNGKVELDPDLVCAVCTELVIDARQVLCCGHIYCRDCIVQWLTLQPNATCPNCRTVQDADKLFVDKRSERQSADHPRNCKYFEDEGCNFIGDRKAVHEHQQCCSFNPNACKNPYCRTLHALEVDRLRRGDENLNHQKELLANIWRTPEDGVKKLFGLQIVRLFNIIDACCDGTYVLKFTWGTERYRCVVDCAHHNVSIMCNAGAALLDRTIRYILLHPTDPTQNHAIDISIPHDNCAVKRGNPNWITEEKFKTFIIGGQFAIGLKTVPYVPE